MNILISADIEGIAGVDGPGFKDESSQDYALACELMTTEVNKIISACFDNGVTEVSVVDGHGSGKNIFLDRLDKRAKLTDKSKSELGMMAGIAEADACIFVGYHGMANKQKSFCAHTSSSRTVSRVTMNGVEIGEGHLNAMIAKSLGKKLLLFIGTDVAVEEMQKNLPSVEYVVTKTSASIHRCEPSLIDNVYAEIQLKVKSALSRVEEIRFIDLNAKDVTMTVSAPYAFFLEGLDGTGVISVGERTVKFEGENILECYQIYRKLLRHMSMRFNQWIV